MFHTKIESLKKMHEETRYRNVAEMTGIEVDVTDVVKLTYKQKEHVLDKENLKSFTAEKIF